MANIQEFFEQWLIKNAFSYSYNMTAIKGCDDSLKYSCKLDVDGSYYTGYGWSSNQEGALNKAMKNYVNFMVQSGYIMPDEVPHDENIDNATTSKKFPPSCVDPKGRSVFMETQIENEACQVVNSKEQPAPVGDGSKYGNCSGRSAFMDETYQVVNSKEQLVPVGDGSKYGNCSGRSAFMDETYQVVNSKEQLVPVGDGLKCGNWTTENAKSRLNLFLQVNKIDTDYHYTIVKAEPPVQFMAEKTIDIPQIGIEITGRELGSSKQNASKNCALSIIKQLVHLGLIEPFSDDTERAKVIPKLIQKLKEQLEKFDIPELSRSVSEVEYLRSHLDLEKKIKLIENMIALTSLPSHQLSLAFNLISRIVELGQKSHLSDSIALGIIQE